MLPIGPCFATPLFRSGTSNSWWYQKISSNDAIERFEEVDEVATERLRDIDEARERAVGQPALFAYLSADNQVHVGDKLELRKVMYDEFEINSTRIHLRHSIAKFLGDQGLINIAKKEVVEWQLRTAKENKPSTRVYGQRQVEPVPLRGLHSSRPNSLWGQINIPLDFRFPGWEDVIGNKCCFHLVGFRDMCMSLGLNRLVDLRQISPQALLTEVPRAVPERWRREFKLAGNIKGSDWLEFSSSQIQHAFRQRPMLLSKAMMTLLFMEMAMSALEETRIASHRLVEFNVFSLIRIEPAVYWVRGFDQDFYFRRVAKNPEVIRTLMSFSGQSRTQLFSDIAQNRRTCTFKTATAIVDTFINNPEIDEEVSFRVVSARERRAASNYEVPPLFGPLPLVPNSRV
jgi:hypothetical protein